MDELIHGVSVVCVYLVTLAVIVLSIRKWTNIPDELFRKVLHFILLGAYVPFLFAFDTWWISAGFAASLIVVIYPLLMLAGCIPAFSRFVNERKKGEFKSSMVLALGVMVLTISIGWGVLHDRYLVLASVYAWGVGDAFAALIGKRFGKHKLKWKFVDCHKSVEGSLAMFVTSVLAVFAVLQIRGGLDVTSCLVISVLTSAVATFVELCSVNGLDTVTCPAISMMIVIVFTKVLGG
ncbi:MAG: hypothetical protein IKU28_03060 [Erysipelotrichaceae bacterium]|nr:hypothetical protein [Erysipelotrichaceae bacterium]